MTRPLPSTTITSSETSANPTTTASPSGSFGITAETTSRAIIVHATSGTPPTESDTSQYFSTDSATRNSQYLSTESATRNRENSPTESATRTNRATLSTTAAAPSTSATEHHVECSTTSRRNTAVAGTTTEDPITATIPSSTAVMWLYNSSSVPDIVTGASWPTSKPPTRPAVQCESLANLSRLATNVMLRTNETFGQYVSIVVNFFKLKSLAHVLVLKGVILILMCFLCYFALCLYIKLFKSR